MKTKRILATILTLAMLIGMFPATVVVSAAEGSLPIYFFISRPGEEPSPSGTYEDYDILASQGSALSTPEAATNSQIATNQGIRNVSPESEITQYIESWPRGYTAETFKEFGTMRLWGVDYSDDEYEITWVTICKRGTSGLSCYCGWNIGAHIHIDGVLSKKVEVTPDTLKVTKTIPVAAGTGGQVFNFNLQKLKQDENFMPINEVDTNFDAIPLKATIAQGETSAPILNANTGTADTLSFGYYRIIEESDPAWEQSNIVYIQVATNGTFRYSYTLNNNSFAVMPDGATLANTYKTYEVNYDDGWNNVTVFEPQKYTGNRYGARMPQFQGGTPEYADRTYVFDGWLYDSNNNGTKDAAETVYQPGSLPATVTEDTYFVAQWKDNAHKVTWLNDNGDVLEIDENVINGETAAYDNTGGSLVALAAAKATAQHTYTFLGWSPAVVPMAGNDQVYTAVYTSVVNKYTVTWVNDNDDELEVDEDVEYNTFPTYDNESGSPDELAAAKNTAEYTYTFLGWSPAPAVVEGNITYKANYTRTKNTYSVRWEDFNGTLLEIDRNVEYGVKPEYNRAAPARAETAGYRYTFIGWKKAGDDTLYTDELGNYPEVEGNVTYVAQYQAVRVKFTGTVNIHLDGVLIDAPVTPETLLGQGTKMYLGNGTQGNATQYYELTKSDTLDYAYQNKDMENGNYYIYISDDETTYTQLCEQILVIENADRERDSYFWSVNYDADGGINCPDTPEYYHNDLPVTVSATVPTRDGYIFIGWRYSDSEGNEVIYQPGKSLTSGITHKYDLVAQWVEDVDLYVNVVIDHTSEAGTDTEETKDNVLIELVTRPDDDTPWIEVGNTKINLDKDTCGATHIYSFTPDTAADLSNYEGSSYTADGVTYSGAELGLRSDYEYSLTAVKAGYELTSVEQVDDTLTAYLKYTPDDFDLQFSLELADELKQLPEEAYPDAAIVRVLRWDDSEQKWSMISQHDNGKPGVSVEIDKQDGQGNGFITVPKGNTAGPYDYRIVVSSFVYDGGISPASTTDYDVFTNEIYTADLENVNSGHEHDSLEGAYYEGSQQVGTLHGVITIGLHNVTFNAQGGTINGDDTYTIENLYKTPDPAEYVPTRDGGYVFDGWYCEQTYENPARKDVRLTEDVTFYAKWIAPWKIKGTVTVDGTYELDGTKIIHDADRIGKVTVLLQKYNPGSGYYATLDAQEVTITYPDDKSLPGTSDEYFFENVPNDGVWRIVVLNHNYTDKYNNEPIDDNNFEGATQAIDGPSVAVDEDGDNTAEVDIHMAFNPQDFDFYYKVIATDIGEDYRPQNAEVLVLYDDNYEDSTSPRLWPVISQMQSGTDYTGKTVTFGTEGAEYSVTDSYPVWELHPLGYLYDYTIKVQAVGGTDLADTAPYMVEYEGTAHYQNPGAYGNQSMLVKATIKPKAYPINYFLEPDSTIKIETLGKKTHTWSFETDISTERPTRQGYVFMGWVDENGVRVSTISADVHTETNVYATWEIDNWKDADETSDTDDKDAPTGGDGIPDSKQVHFLYNSGENGTTSPIGEIYTIDGEDFEDVTVTATSGTTPAPVADYAVDKWEYKGSSDGGDNATALFTPDGNHKIIPTINNADGGKTYTFEVTFAIDTKGKPTGPDGIADKYQAFVEFRSGNSVQGTVEPAIGFTAEGSVYQTFNFGTETEGEVTPDVSKIKLNPAEGYAFDYWTKAGETEKLYELPTLISGVPGGTTIVYYAHFSIDEWDDGDDTDEEGDGVPDNRQALVKYIPTANHFGEVTGDGAVQVFTIEKNAGGEYIGNIDPDDNVVVEPNPGWAFDYWGDPDGFWGERGGKLDNEKPFAVHAEVRGGQIITYVAHFGEDSWKDADQTPDPLDDDAPIGGDDVPDSKQIFIDYTSENPEKGTVSESAEAITLTDETIYNAIGSTATPTDGNAFDRWRLVQDYSVTFDSTEPVLAPVINNPTGGSRYSFYASFDTDANNDGIPDKYQAYVEFVSADIERGSVGGTGVRQTFTFYDESGNYAYSGTVTPDLTNVAVNPENRYEFDYWTIGEDSTELDNTAVQAPIDNVYGGTTITIKAYFYKTPGGGGGGGVTRYTLTYESNGGTEYAKETYNRNTTVKIDKTPTKEGYVFEGWYEDKELTKYVEEVKMTKNITVYAKWVEDNGGAGSGYDTPGSLNGEDHFAYVVGYPDGTVRPNDNISRAEVTSIFFRLLKPDEVREQNLTDENGFADVNTADWYNTAISTMAKLGIVNGRTEESFVPNAFITRAEFAAICARFDNSEFEVIDNFTDVDGHWAEDEIHEAAAHGWIRGYQDGTFKPDQFITRAEAMTMINRVLNRVPETVDDLLSDMIQWPDNNDESAWYYIAVQEATNSHDYDMKNHIYEKWTALREVTDWSKYE